MPVDVYSSISAMAPRAGEAAPKLILISIDNLKRADIPETIRGASMVAPAAPIVVLSYSRELHIVREVMDYGVKGYIPMTMGFDVAIGAVRFVLAGGTYVPVECIMDGEPELPRPLQSGPLNVITEREMAVIRAIQQGKPNKIIAYELNVCESTVKVHIRNIMKKLQAKNRTEVAVKSAEMMTPGHPK
jgi:DNA-binding NarL/FixJ family response regulator